MRRVVIVLVAGMLAACAATVQDQSARMKAFQADLDAALAEWQERVGQKFYPTSVGATQDLVARYDGVYSRWGMTADALSQALMAYSVALAARVDRGQISADAANRLLASMKADIDREKQRLASTGEVGAAQNASMLRWWTSYWTTNRVRYEANQQQPVTCQVAPAASGGARVVCL